MPNEDNNLSAEEKIKQLLEFEDAKRKELKAKKKELEKELKKLEKKGKEEIIQARKEIEEKIAEVILEEKRRFEELEELRRRRDAEASLEETVAEEAGQGAAQEAQEHRGYGDIFEEILEGSPTFYDITNYNVVNRLENIARAAVERPLSPSERAFIDNVQYHAEKMQANAFYRDKDASAYMKKELEKIGQINKLAREKKMTGDYKT
jgi:hypothetical protein